VMPDFQVFQIVHIVNMHCRDVTIARNYEKLFKALKPKRKLKLIRFEFKDEIEAYKYISEFRDIQSRSGQMQESISRGENENE